MKIRDLRATRKDFDQRYEVNYPQPTPRTPDEPGASSNVVLIIWGIVSIAGAIISLPHTLNAVGASINLDPILSIGYSIAVFIGVELALLMVAYTQAQRQIENPTPRTVITIATILASILYRMGLRHRPTPPTSDNDGGIGGLLVMLLGSALLFNLADTTGNEVLQSATKTVSGILAPALLFLAGHEFAHHLAGKLLATKIALRANEQALEAWKTERNDSWRDYADKPLEVGQKIPLEVSNTQMNLLREWDADDRANTATMRNGNGNFIEPSTTFLMKEKE